MSNVENDVLRKGPSDLFHGLATGCSAALCGQRTPIHYNIPHTTICRVYRGEKDEHGAHRVDLLQSIKTKTHVVEDREHILSTVDEMRENVSCVPITAETLQSSPNAR